MRKVYLIQDPNEKLVKNFEDSLLCIPDKELANRVLKEWNSTLSGSIFKLIEFQEVEV